MTGDRVAEIAARLESATPGPWETTQAADEESTTWIEAPSGDVLNHDECGHGHMRENFAWMRRADADLIANAPSDLRYLMAEVAALRGRLAAVEWLADEWDKVSDKEMSFRFAVSLLRAALATGEGEYNAE